MQWNEYGQKDTQSYGAQAGSEHLYRRVLVKPLTPAGTGSEKAPDMLLLQPTGSPSEIPQAWRRSNSFPASCLDL